MWTGNAKDPREPLRLRGRHWPASGVWLRLRALTVPERAGAENGATTITTTLRMARAAMYRMGCTDASSSLTLFSSSQAGPATLSLSLAIAHGVSGWVTFPRSPWPTNGRAEIQTEKGPRTWGLVLCTFNLKFFIMLSLNLFCKTGLWNNGECAWSLEPGLPQGPTPQGSSSAPDPANTAAPARAGHGGLGGGHSPREYPPTEET